MHDRPDTFSEPFEEPPEALFYTFHEFERSELLDMGLAVWEDDHLLLPYEWRDHIPEEYPVKSISGDYESYDKSEWTDQRFGCIACGIDLDDEMWLDDTQVAKELYTFAIITGYGQN